MLKDFVKQVRRFFGFSRAETNGFLVLLPLMVAMIFSEPLYRTFFARAPDFSQTDLKVRDSLAAMLQTQPSGSFDSAAITAEIFPFDPATASHEELKRLGFPDRLAGRIVNYRNKGGQFRKKEDLLNIYGMDTALYRRLVPAIRLSVEQKKSPAFTFEKKETQRTKRDINMADTTQLKEVFGIGSKLATRIVRYRDRLGGFVATHQLAEVYGLDSTVVTRVWTRFFIAPDFQPKPLMINSASAETLAGHPYLSSSAARAITAYRFQHGRIDSVEDIEKIRLLDAGTIRKILPYLNFD